MKRSKKPRVSWPPGPKLCQVKLFRTEDCPAKVTSQSQRHNYPKQSTVKSRDPDLPPGFENYVAKQRIPSIKWKPPTKMVTHETWQVAYGEKSTQRLDQDLRIIKLSEAIYPHRSAIPSRPFVSPVVEAEHYDDSKTPVIPITFLEGDECEPAEGPLESSSTANKQDQLITEAPVSDPAPSVSQIAAAALAVLMKTKEQGSLIDPDLLVKLLSDPDIVKKLLTTDTTGKSSETKNEPVDANSNPTTLVPQHVTASPIASKPQPVIITQEQRVAVAKPSTSSEQRRVSPPIPGNGNIFSLNPLNGNPTMPVHSSVGIATKPPPPPVWFPSSSLPMNPNLQRPQNAFPEPKVIVNPHPQLQPYPQFRTSEMNHVQAPVGYGRGPQIGFHSYPMNLNQVNGTCRPNPVVQPPTRRADYFKNLIREHGTEMDQYHSQNGKFSGRVEQIKVQKPCIYFGSARGCASGDNCIYVHDRLRPNFETEAPMAKRMKFRRY